MMNNEAETKVVEPAAVAGDYKITVSDPRLQDSVDSGELDEYKDAYKARDEKNSTEQHNGYINDKEAFERKYPDKKYVSQEEFEARGPLFNKIKNLQEQNKELSNILKNHASYLKEARKEEYDRAIYELSTMRDSALDKGSRTEVHNIENKMIAAQKQYEKVQQLPEPSPIVEEQVFDPALVSFAERNKTWFSNEVSYTETGDLSPNSIENQAMIQVTADAEREFRTNRPGIPEKVLWGAVEAKVKAMFPHRFENARRAAPSPVSGSVGRAGDSLGKSSVKLTRNQLKIAQQAVEMGYFKDVSEYESALKK